VAERAVSSADLPGGRTTAGWRRRALAARLGDVAPLVPFLTANWLIFAAMNALLYSPALKVFDAGWLPYAHGARQAAYILSPNALLMAERHTVAGALVHLLYAALSCLAVYGWCRAVQAARTLDRASLGPLLLLTLALATVPLFFVGLFSDDLFLYHAYGRTIETYGANPLLYAPAEFPADPLLPLVYWRDLPSAYGPVWLLLSAPVSRLAGTDPTAAVLAFRGLALVLHLATAAALWVVLRRVAPREAAAGLVFYAWNPLVLVEVVANAHNDVLVALLAVMVAGAAAVRAWNRAAVLTACAILVKPFAVLLLAPLGLRILRATPPAHRTRVVAASIAAGAATSLALSLPLWAGTAWLTNIIQNPASYMYTNTIWELISRIGPWMGVTTVAIQHPYLDWLTTAAFLVGAAWVLARRWPPRGLAPAALYLWVLFCLTAPWVWPWYFVPVIALAPLARGAGVALAAALTLGGLLFWTTWPPPPDGGGWLYTWRSLVLFGPVLVIIASHDVRRRVAAAFATRPPQVGARTLVPTRLRPLEPPLQA
jgi:alpha-1,6-mannosyltransferase